MALASLHLQPWARDEQRPALGDIWTRVNLERGHFRDITEASLQEEIAADGALRGSDSEEEDEDDEDDLPDEEPPARQQPQTADDLAGVKQELLQCLHDAENDLAVALDSISLVQSTHARNAAVPTFSPLLQRLIPPATVGTDVWKSTPPDPARQAEDARIATNVRMANLQESADSLLAAATRLNDNVRKETQYWQQVLSVSERGWNISKVPGQPYHAVHFGFGGSAPEFAQRNVAALVSGEGGDITLERGIGTKPKTVRALIRRDGRVVGSTRLPMIPDPGESTLEARIRYARDSVFDEELYHELTREARELGSAGVRITSSGITFPMSDASAEQADTISFQFVALDEDNSFDAAATSEDNVHAQAALLAARLLLCRAHRERLRKYTEVPPPLTDRVDEKPIYSILAPLIMIASHQALITQLNSYTANLASLLRRADVGITIRPFSFTFDAPPTAAGAEALIARLTQPFVHHATLAIAQPGDAHPTKLETATYFTTLDLQIETTCAFPAAAVLTVTNSAFPAPLTHRFTAVSDFTEALDALVTEGLTRALHRVVGGGSEGWTCDARAGLVVRKMERVGAMGERVGVVVDGRRKRLVLEGRERRVVWTGEEGIPSEGRGFWEVARGLRAGEGGGTERGAG